MILHFFGADSKTTNIHSEIAIWEFFVSCIKIAVYKYITLTKKEIMARKKKGRQTLHSTASSSRTCSEALSMLYDEHLKPVLDRLPASAAIKATLGSEEGLLLLHEHLVILSRTFCKYSETPFDSDALDDCILAGVLNVKQFSAFAADFEFLGMSRSEKNMTLKDLRQVFSASQQDQASNEAETQLEDDNDHQELMVFPEFVEAVARLGVLKYATSDDDEKHMVSIQMALDRIKN